ncbi:MAG: hypothetical protein ACREP8_06555 [Candidatus Binatia bacterium]
MVKLARALLIIIAGVLLSACSTTAPEVKAPLKTAIVGKWRQVDGTRTVQFFTEGTMISVTGQRALAASYKVLDDATLEVEPKYHMGATLAPTILIKATFAKDVLTLTDSKETVKYRREE